MSENHYDLLAVCVDGETKTGKGAAGKAIAAALKDKGLRVYYDVAGDFFRRYVALVRLQLGLEESDILPTGDVLESAAKAVLASRKPFEKNEELGDLQRPAISQSVAILSELPLVQQAGAEWWAITLQLATEAGADAVVLDGRNPRNRVSDASAKTGIDVQIILDLFMTCESVEAARRTLKLEGNASPTAEQLETATKKVDQRRGKDRQRSEQPFLLPVYTINYDPEHLAADEAILRSWQHANAKVELPTAIKIDNTHFGELEMLAAVKELAIASVEYSKKQ
ncbi:MAG TPA: (d)CMP kinase [Patescibacteria group bacterium]|nr:(d)CMP kinase [Patescibacteria group bacterium]